jgi:hypothetical protein
MNTTEGMSATAVGGSALSEGLAVSRDGPRPLNKYRDAPTPGAVYVGRPTKWGNPFVIGKDGTRTEVISKYRNWLASDAGATIREAAKRELRGRDLICFCSPQACHAQVLIETANV